MVVRAQTVYSKRVLSIEKPVYQERIKRKVGSFDFSTRCPGFFVPKIRLFPNRCMPYTITPHVTTIRDSLSVVKYLFPGNPKKMIPFK